VVPGLVPLCRRMQNIPNERLWLIGQCGIFLIGGCDWLDVTEYSSLSPDASVSCLPSSRT
jgi:hypothetical protein